MKRLDRGVLVTYALFILAGLGTGANGVLLPAQIRDYGVDATTIGLTFFPSAAGFLLGGLVSGPLLHRLGTRSGQLIAGAAFILASVYLATRPPFVAFALVQLLLGMGLGLFESVCNSYVAHRGNATTRMNRLHAFFGIGALLGPPLTAGLLRFFAWPSFFLTSAIIAVPLLVGVILTYPGHAGDPVSVASRAETTGSLVPTALRSPAVLLAATLLSVYVGLEVSVNNWGFTYLIHTRDLSDLVAGYIASGFWFGIMLGRFLISPVLARFGLTQVGLMYTVVIGSVVTTVLIAAVPSAAVAGVGLLLLGFFFGPIFPTTMAVTPRLTEPGLVPTAIGVMNAGCTVFGAVLPWLAGVFIQRAGTWTLLPVAVVFALAQLAVWWRVVPYLRSPTREPVPERT